MPESKAGSDKRTEKQERLPQPLAQALAGVTWEQAAWAVLILAALALRLWALGDRAVSFDESEHTYFTWLFYKGGTYTFDPITHGPFLFHVTALTYALFGATDFTSRIPPALFGTLLVVLPLFLRRWLGRGGALVAGIILTVSPSLLFYSRDNLHEIYGCVWAVLMAIALFRYFDTRKDKYIYLFGVATALYLCTKAVAFIVGFIFVTFILAVMFWESLSPSTARLVRRVGLAVGGVGAVLALWLTNRPAPVGALPQSGGLLHVVVLLICFLVAVVLAGFAWKRDDEGRPVTRALSSMRWQPLLATVAIGLAIWVTLYTTLFTNPRGVGGPITLLSYWLGQHGGARGGQPWYYFLLVLMPMYEFLPLLGALVGIVYYAFVRRTASRERDSQPFVPFLVFWTVMAVALHSWTGEKMPQHTTYLAVPMALLTGRLLQDWLGGVDWRAAWKKGAAWFIVGIPVAGYALVRLLSSKPFRGFSLRQLNQTLAWLLGLVVAAALAWGLSRLALRLGKRLALQAAAVSIFLSLLLLTVRFAWMANFVNYDTAKELIVYAHGSQDAKATLDEVLTISRRIAGDNLLKVAHDAKLGFPMTSWYFRDWPNAVSFSGDNPTPDAVDAPVVLVHTANEGKIKPFLANNYNRYPRRVMWWPNEDYKNLTPSRVLNALRDPVKRQEIWDILWNREYPRSLNDWYYREDFALYIRKDVVAQMWGYSTGPTAPSVPVEEDEYLTKHFLMPSLLQFGQMGQGPGQFMDPRNVAVDGEGNVYVADTNNHRVQVFDSRGNYLREWGSQGEEPGQFNEPWGIAVDGAGKVYVADTWNHRVQVFESDGTFVGMWGTFGDSAGDAYALPGQFYGPREVAIAADGTVLVSDTGNKRIQRFTAEGEYVAGYGGFGAGEGQFWEPVGLAVDGAGNVYVADTWNHRIQKFDGNMGFVAAWEVKTWAGESVVNKPYLAVDGRGHVFASDPEGYRVLEWDGDGVFVASYGEYGSGVDKMNLPMGLAVDGEGNLWLADSGNHRIMKFAPMGQ